MANGVLLLKACPILPWGGGLFGLFVYAGLKGEMYVCLAGLGLLVVNALICIHTARVHRRLDALLKLLDFDHKSKDDSNNSTTEKAG